MYAEAGVRRSLHPPPSGEDQQVNKVRIVHVEQPQSPPIDNIASGSNDDFVGGFERTKKSYQQSNSDFCIRYSLVEQIGKGASSTVWRCVEKVSGSVYAAKIIDLRPLKFRERFNIGRLRREIDIMRKLKHPSIIHMEDAFETEDQLILVLEFAQGIELFDAILARKSFTEDDARPIFLQVAKALYYLHSMSIIHRDIKPENVMIREDPENGRYPIAKLLDFGLSKMVGEEMGSAAKTFVGTPCYLAPEVEMRSRGEGGSYGTAVDCWSLGAVLYVMLAARFPEFTVVQGRQTVRMIGQTWNNVSANAKSLIRGLMAFDPTQRMTVDQALHSAWATKGTSSPPPLPLSLLGMDNTPTLPPKPAPSSEQLQIEAPKRPQLPLSKGDSRALAVACPDMDLAPLLKLQASIAGCLDSATRTFSGGSPATAATLRRSALLCRENLMSSMKLLRKIEHTAAAVLELFPDLTLAVEEQEPALAHEFFSTVRTWVGDLYAAVKDVQRSNQANTHVVSDLMAANAMEVSGEPKKKETKKTEEKRRVSITQDTIDLVEKVKSKSFTESVDDDDGRFLDLFLHFAKVKPASPPIDHADIDLPPQSNTMENLNQNKAHGVLEGISSTGSVISDDHEDARELKLREMSVDEGANPSDISVPSTNHIQIADKNLPPATVLADVQHALDLLREVDLVLEQLAMFWANTEVIFDLLLRKGDLVEKFVAFAHKPRLLYRFKERMGEYERFWEGIRHLCNHYISGNQNCRAYAYLDEVTRGSAHRASNKNED